MGRWLVSWDSGLFWANVTNVLFACIGTELCSVALLTGRPYLVSMNPDFSVEIIIMIYGHVSQIHKALDDKQWNVS